MKKKTLRQAKRMKKLVSLTVAVSSIAANSQSYVFASTTVDPDTSIVSAPTNVVAGLNNVVVQVTPKDANAQPLGSDQAVNVSDGQTVLSAVYNQTNQDYEATFSETTASTVTFDAYVGGVALTEQPQTIVSPSSIAAPILQTTDTSFDGLSIILTFDKDMADPSALANEFNVNVNGAFDKVNAVTYGTDEYGEPLDTYQNKIQLKLASPIIKGDSVTISYTPGTLLAADGGIATAFNQSVTNNVRLSLAVQNDAYGIPVIAVQGIDSQPDQIDLAEGSYYYNQDAVGYDWSNFRKSGNTYYIPVDFLHDTNLHKITIYFSDVDGNYGMTGVGSINVQAGNALVTKAAFQNDQTMTGDVLFTLPNDLKGADSYQMYDETTGAIIPATLLSSSGADVLKIPLDQSYTNPNYSRFVILAIYADGTIKPSEGTETSIRPAALCNVMDAASKPVTTGSVYVSNSWEASGPIDLSNLTLLGDGYDVNAYLPSANTVNIYRPGQDQYIDPTLQWGSTTLTLPDMMNGTDYTWKLLHDDGTPVAGATMQIALQGNAITSGLDPIPVELESDQNGEIKFHLQQGIDPNDVVLNQISWKDSNNNLQTNTFSNASLGNNPYLDPNSTSNAFYDVENPANSQVGQLSQGSTLSKSTASFDKSIEKQVDIPITLNLNGNTLTDIKNGNTLLRSGTDYVFNGSNITISKNYLSTLPNGTVTLTFDFSAGHSQTLTITIADTSSTGGSTGGNSGGGSVPPTTTTTTNQNGKSIITIPVSSTTTTTNASGQTVTLAKVDLNTMTNAIQNATSTNGSAGIVLQVQSNGSDAVQTQFDANALNVLTNNAKGATFTLQSDLATIHLSAIAVEQAISQLGISMDGATIRVTVSKLDAATEQSVNQILSRVGTTALVSPIDFSIQVTDQSGTTHTLHNLPAYVGHTLNLPNSDNSLPLKNLAGVMIDPETGTYTPVPTVFQTDSNGNLQAQLYRNGNSIYTIVQNNKTFTDVQNNYAKDAIDILASKYILSGYNDGTYQPNKPVTRAEFITMLTRALGVAPNKTNDPTTFKDVQASDLYAGAIGAAVKANLIKGYTDGTFKPNQEISRMEMLQMIYNAMQSSGMLKDSVSPSDVDLLLSKYADHTQVEGWAKEAVAEAIQAGITSGVGNNQLAPTKNSDRAQSASFLYRMLQKLNLIN